MSRFVLLVLAVLAVVLATPGPANAGVLYSPPVLAPVVDGFHLPNGPYGAGNRGLEYATSPGDQVRAIGDGLVVFAGPVAGQVAVTVLHADGLRSSYSYLADATVTAGERVARGTVVGLAGEQFHLGVRSAGTYLDPAALFAATGVRLVPVEGGSPTDAATTTPDSTERGRRSSAPAVGDLGPRPPSADVGVSESSTVSSAWDWLTG